ncbi:MAG: zinc ribbon domain-containing protein [Clostridia bacterium]|nr:zinc ribbon domain-containing protein [Clostridia bacterium]
MALIKCDECGAVISSGARVCPHCGYPVPVEKTLNKGVKNTITIVRILTLCLAIVFAVLFVVSLINLRRDYQMVKAQLDRKSMGTSWTEQWHEENYGDLPAPDVEVDYGANLQSTLLWSAIKFMLMLVFIILTLEIDSRKLMRRSRK